MDWALIRSRIGIVDLLYNQGSRYRYRYFPKPGKPFHVSEICKTYCPRQVVLGSMGDVVLQSEITPDNEFIFAVGHGIHSAFQNSVLKGILVGSWRCKGCGWVQGSMTNLLPVPKSCPGSLWNPETQELNQCPNHNYSVEVHKNWHLPGFEYQEISVKIDGLNIIGHPDGILWKGEGDPPLNLTVDNPYLELMEGKSCREEHLEHGLYGSRPWRQEAYKEHVKQCMIYMYALGMKSGRIVYLNKAGRGLRSSVVDHPVNLDLDFLSREVFDDLLAVKGALDSNDASLARGLCTTSTCNRAKACVVRDACWGLEPEASDVEKDDE